jgi:hypothetical protein
MMAIVNRELARRTWPGESPLGERITLPGPPEVEATAVGVVGNVKQLTLSGADEQQIYLAKAQNGGSSPASRPAPRLIERQLFGVPAADLVTFVAVPLVPVAVAAVACWVPARRAARVDPAVALSAE